MLLTCHHDLFYECSDSLDLGLHGECIRNLLGHPSRYKVACGRRSVATGATPDEAIDNAIARWEKQHRRV